MGPSSHLDTLSGYPSSSEKKDFAPLATKPALAKILSEQKSKTMSVNNQGGLMVKESNYIPMSVKQHDGETVIDSLVELEQSMTNTITNKLKKEIAGLTTDDNATKEHQILSHLQDILQTELGTIIDISGAESEQSQAIENSETGIIKSHQLSQKMCTLRAGYTVQVLKSLGRETTVLCGSMDKQGHARTLLKSRSGQTMMYDPMNPLMSQGRPFVNMLSLTNEYESMKSGTYKGMIQMNGHRYNMGIDMKENSEN